MARVFLGIHYPSDVAVGALLGIATSLAVNREWVRKTIAARILAYEVRYPPWFYGLFFLARRIVRRIPEHEMDRGGRRPPVRRLQQIIGRRCRVRARSGRCPCPALGILS
jgi:hypothetical protein